jgi:hypothetical protein
LAIGAKRKLIDFIKLGPVFMIGLYISETFSNAAEEISNNSMQILKGGFVHPYSMNRDRL